MRYLSPLSVIVLCMLALVGGVVAQDEEAQPVFGAIESYYRPDDAVELGIQWDRIIFAWNLIQPESAGDFNTDVVPQAYLDDARAAGRQIVGLIKGTPEWASRSGSLGAPPNGLNLPYDNPRNVWGQFVTRLVEHYSAEGIHHWIIWNEPDIRPGEGSVEFQGEVEDYAALLRTAYLAAKAADPTAHIQTAGMSWWHDVNAFRTPFLVRLLEVIHRDEDAREHNYYFDGISLHIYFRTETVWPILEANREILASFGLQNKEIWLNEFNASPRLDPDAEIDAPFQSTNQQQADFVVQTSALALAAGLDRMAVYRLFDNDFTPGVSEPWGLVRHDGSLRPAAEAYARIITEYAGFRRVERFTTGQGTLVMFVYPDRTRYVMWNDSLEEGRFLINVGGGEGEITVVTAIGEEDTQALTNQAGAWLAIVAVPPAELMDLPFTIVSGEVREVVVEGTPRTIWYQGEGGAVTQLR